MNENIRLNLWMAQRYLVHIIDKPAHLFTKYDKFLLEKIGEIATNKKREVATVELKEKALCEDAAVTTPRMSICGRCPAISAAPDGSGYMCALSRRAILESENNSPFSDTLASPKINPESGSPRFSQEGV